MSCAPACCYRGGVLSFDNGVLVPLCHDTFVGHQEPGSYLNALCSQHVCCCDPSSICDTAGCDDRDIKRIHHLRN